jgi:hypothetical protein
MAIIRFQCPHGTREERVKAWQAVEAVKRLAIGQDVRQLDEHGIEWWTFTSLKAMCEAAKNL